MKSATQVLNEVHQARAYGSLVRSKATIKGMLETWIANLNAGHQPLEYNTHCSHNPLTHIRSALAKCPDEAPALGTSDLTFITDAGLRTELQIDIARVNTALANGEWKAATVLAGSAAEALLLWKLKQRSPADIASAIAALRKSGNLSTNPDPNQLEAREWDLYGYIQVAERLGAITPETATAARLAKDFRNLIHPGRALRLAQKCDRATALSAVAAMEHVVRDLTP
jgi:hypothetical protein